jgi:hypothetical protein
MDEEKEL